jgi:hypothetical protein
MRLISIINALMLLVGAVCVYSILFVPPANDISIGLLGLACGYGIGRLLSYGL